MKHGRKATFILFVSMALTLVCAAQNYATVYKQPVMKGRVKTVTETSYMLMKKADGFDKGSMRWMWCLKRQYDTTGNVVIMNGYNQAGNQLYTDTIPYNSYGKPTVRYYHSRTKRSQTIYEYNNEGQLISDIDYDTIGRLKRRIFYAYDTNGNCISWTGIDSAGAIKSVTMFEYDSAYNVIEQRDSSVLKAKRITASQHYYYNHNRQLIKELVSLYYTNVQKQIERVYTYDKYGNTLSTISYQTDAKTGKPVTNTITNKYRYDKTGNWMERKAYEDGKLVGHDTREIEYY